MVVITAVEHDLWEDPYVKVIGMIEDDVYFKYKKWVEEKPLERRDYFLNFINTNNLEDLTLNFINKMEDA